MHTRLTFCRELVLLPSLSLYPEALITLEAAVVDLIHVEHTDGVHAPAAVDAGNHWLSINGVVFHLLEDTLHDDGGCEWVITNCHLVRGDLTETLGAVDISGEERKK